MTDQPSATLVTDDVPPLPKIPHANHDIVRRVWLAARDLATEGGKVVTASQAADRAGVGVKVTSTVKTGLVKAGLWPSPATGRPRPARDRDVPGGAAMIKPSTGVNAMQANDDGDNGGVGLDVIRKAWKKYIQEGANGSQWYGFRVGFRDGHAHALAHAKPSDFTVVTWSDYFADFCARHATGQPEPEPTTPDAGDPINPSYYVRDGIECIDLIRASLSDERFAGYLEGTAIAYGFRKGAKTPDPTQDEQKRAWYKARLEAHESEQARLNEMPLHEYLAWLAGDALRCRDIIMRAAEWEKEGGER